MTRLAIPVALLIASGTAAAQTAYEPRDLTRGVSTTGGVAGDHDATAVTLNPGGLGTLGGASAAFTFTQLDGDSLVGGGGWSLALGLPLVFNLPNQNRFALTYGFGFQSLDSPDSWVGPVVGGESQDGSYLLNSLAIGTEQFGIGYTIGTFFWTDTPQDQSIITHHLGLSLRPFRFAALGMTLRDIFEPVGRDPAEQFNRSFDSELMVRPLGDWRIEFGGGVTVGADDLIDFRGRAIARPIRGLTLFANYEAVERHFAGQAADPSRDHRFTAGITIDGVDGLLGRRAPQVSASYAALASTETSGGYAGSSVTASFTAEKLPALVERERVEMLSFESGLDDRQFVRRLLYLRRAEKAGDIAGFVLVLGANTLGWGRTDELREAVTRLRAAGKKVLVYLRAGGMRQYLVASAADRVVAHPTVSLELTGVATQVVFLKGLLDKLGVAADVLKIGEYKSAPESLTRTSASKPARHQLEVFVGDVADRFVEAVAAGRKRPAAEVRALFDRAAIPPREAQSLGLIDSIAHPDELENATRAMFGGSKIALTERSKRPVRPSQWTYPEIAVIHIDGDITPGPSTPGLFGASITGDDIADAIKKARESDGIRAIILRINSPGGAVQPSERIAREVELTRGKKPIIVSMADLAASGGYMSAAYGETIFAPPNALTGSIGIFSIKLDLDRLIARLGVSVETVKVGDHADANSAFRAWSAPERQAQQRVLAYLYDRFVKLVAEGREMDPARVDQVGRGRIWSGSRARTAGLVDRTGGFLAAFDEARRRTGLPSRTEVRAVQLPVPAAGLFAQLFSIKSAAEVVSASIPAALYHGLEKLPAVLLHGGGDLARLDFIEVE